MKFQQLSQPIATIDSIVHMQTMQLFQGVDSALSTPGLYL